MLEEEKKVRACGKARYGNFGTSEEAEKGSGKVEKGTQGRSHQPGRNGNGVSEHQRGGAGVGKIRHANLRHGRQR